MLKDFFDQKFDFFGEFSKRDRLVFVFCLFLGTFCSALLTPYFDGFLEMRSFSQSSQPIIGKITYKSNDVQIKSQQELVWFKAKNDQDVRTGDSVFSGEKSYSQIEINKTNTIVLGENSLILFQEIIDEKIANLKDGNFRLKVDGDIKVAIGGKLAEIKGNQSEIQVFLSKNQPAQVKLLSGQATLTESGKETQVLSEGTIAKIDTKPEEPAAKTLPVPHHDTKTIRYTWKLNDFYKLQDGQLSALPAPETVVAQKELSWFIDKPENEAIVELAGKMDFSNKKIYTTQTPNISLPEVFVGKNYWRIKEKDGEWSEISEFELTAEFKRSPNLTQMLSYEKNIALIGSQTQGIMKFQKMSHTAGYVLESSTDENFNSNNTDIKYITDSTLTSVYETPGIYFYRIRTLNDAEELSDWSKTFSIEVFSPNAPKTPQLGLAKTKVFLYEEAVLSWEVPSNYRVITEIRDDQNRLVKKIEGHDIAEKFKNPGHYFAISWSVDKYGQRSNLSNQISIEVFQDPSKVTGTDRNVAGSDLIETNIFSNGGNFLNDGYKLPKFSMNAFVWNLISSEQLANNTSTPSVTGIGVKVMHWIKNQGFSAFLKSGIASTGGSQSQLKSLEGLYHYRFIMSSDRFFRELQVSLVAGFETYRNVSDLVFSSKYDLIKVGVNSSFPWRDKWVGTGAFVVGYGLDGSTKYEVSGEVDYYLNKAWSLGFGYKIHLFEAGSVSSSGNGLLPYREGYTEGYSLLNYDY